MTAAELNALERDVEVARERFAVDLARLRDPVNYTSLKDDLLKKARDAKDDLLDKAKSKATDAAHEFVEEVKQKAMANPAAVIAIGAGVAWRLLHRPPIASLLVGIGMISLWRTPPQATAYKGIYEEHPGYRPSDRPLVQMSDLGDVAGAAKSKIQDWAGDVSDTIKGKANSLADKAGTVIEDVSSAAASMTREAGRQVSTAGEKAATAVRDAMPEEDTRDKMLLGAAALAVIAAVGMAYQRRNEQAD
jgi:hypothetical protein